MPETSLILVTTVILASSALLAPYVAEFLKRRWFAPKLALDFDMVPPTCHWTKQTFQAWGERVEHRPVFYVRFSLVNRGKSQARRCEAVLESLARVTEAGEVTSHDRFTPIPLTWSAGLGEFVDINPERRVYCDFLTLADPVVQKYNDEMEAHLRWDDDETTELGLRLCSPISLFSQPNLLSPGHYHLGVAVYSENAPTVKRVFLVEWNGEWPHSQEAPPPGLAVELNGGTGGRLRALSRRGLFVRA
jgi:hypothetical protein